MRFEPGHATWEGRAIRRVSSDILGPSAASLTGAVPRLRSVVATLAPPWDGVLLVGTFAALYATAVIGSELIVTAGASAPVALLGFAGVALSVGISAKLYGGLEAVATARG